MLFLFKVISFAFKKENVVTASSKNVILIPFEFVNFNLISLCLMIFSINCFPDAIGNKIETCYRKENGKSGP